MWIFARNFVISIVAIEPENPMYRDLPLPVDCGERPYLQVRGRLREHLGRVVALYRREFPGREAPEIIALHGHDYEYRIVVRQDEAATLIARAVGEVRYGNYKAEAIRSATSDVERRGLASVLHQVWGAVATLPTVLQSRRAGRRRL